MSAALDNLPEPWRARTVALCRRLAEMESVVIGLSGGTDSSLLTALAGLTPGLRALAVTVVSAFVPEAEGRAAAAVAARARVPHRLLRLDVLAHDAVRTNPPDRCYHCKRLVFGALIELAQTEGYAAVLDGSNADDDRDYRPGRRALDELEVRSPLRQAGWSKADVRAVSHLLGLPGADTPASACLASRVPYGTALEAGLLERIGRAEDALRALGYRQVRVRAHGPVARLELPPAEIAAAAASPRRERIAELLKAQGFRYVALDLDGYRMGSLNPA